VIDQYLVSTDWRSGITSDPNREDDPEDIVRLVGRVITVSVETVRLVRALRAVNGSPLLLGVFCVRRGMHAEAVHGGTKMDEAGTIQA